MRCEVIDIRGNKKQILGKKLLILYILNITDLLFTKFLLSNGSNMFKEVNIFLKPIINDNLAYLVKIGGMTIILIYWYWRSEKSNLSQINRSIKVSKVLLWIYIIINIMHLANLALYFYLK